MLLLLSDNDDLRQRLEAEAAERKKETAELRERLEKETGDLKEKLDNEIAERKVRRWPITREDNADVVFRRTGIGFKMLLTRTRAKERMK